MNLLTPQEKLELANKLVNVFHEYTATKEVPDVDNADVFLLAFYAATDVGTRNYHLSTFAGAEANRK